MKNTLKTTAARVSGRNHPPPVPPAAAGSDRVTAATRRPWILNGRAGVFWTALGAGLALAAGRLVLFAAECGSSGNTFWTWDRAMHVQGTTVDETNVFATAGTTLGCFAKTNAQRISGSRKLYVGSGMGRVHQLNPATGVMESYATIYPSYIPVRTVLVTSADTNSSQNRLVATATNWVKYICIPWQSGGGDRAFAGGGNESPAVKDSPNLVSVPVCEDPNASVDGLILWSDPATVTSFPGESVTGSLSVLNSTRYPFQCVNLLDLLPEGLGVQSLVSTNAATPWDTNSFLVQPTGALPVTASLTLTSSVPGTYHAHVVERGSSPCHSHRDQSRHRLAHAIHRACGGTTGSDVERERRRLPIGARTQPHPTSGVADDFQWHHHVRRPPCYPVSDALTTNRFYRLRKP